MNKLTPERLRHTLIRTSDIHRDRLPCSVEVGIDLHIEEIREVAAQVDDHLMIGLAHRAIEEAFHRGCGV